MSASKKIKLTHEKLTTNLSQQYTLSQQQQQQQLRESRWPRQQSSLLGRIHSDVLVYSILIYLGDYDAFECLKACKYLYEHCLPKYCLKKEINIADIGNFPTFQLDSTRPIPIIEKIRCRIIDELYAIKINRKQIKFLRNLQLKPATEPAATFGKIPKSLIGLEIWDLEVTLMPNCFPPYLKYLGLNATPALDLPGIFPTTLQSLIIGHDWEYHDDSDDNNDRFNYGMKEALSPHILPPSLKQLETNYVFQDHPLGPGILPSSLESLAFFVENEIFAESGKRSSARWHSRFNFRLLPGSLLSSLKQLQLDYRYIQPLATMYYHPQLKFKI